MVIYKTTGSSVPNGNGDCRLTVPFLILYTIILGIVNYYSYIYRTLKHYTMKTQKEIIEFLEALVHNRFSLISLNEKLSEFFGVKIRVYNASQGRINCGEEDDELSDWNLMFNFNSEDVDANPVDVDIYMLPMRREGFDGTTMYITEVGYEFI